MAIKIQIRRDLAANWTSVNPTLAQGELGFEIDTEQLKIGNGTQNWVALPYFNPQSSLVDSETSVNITITNEDFLLVTGTLPVTVTLPNSAERRITIKSICEDVVTIVPTSGTINGVSNIQLSPILSGGLAEGNLGASVTFIYRGGQFWVN